MKKSIIFAAVAAIVLAGCAKNETFVKNYDEEAVSFGAYSGRTLTKAGVTDDMNLNALKIDTVGFGVFATYTGIDAFEDAANDKGAKDDFMYNQQVTWDGSSAWIYSPIKYWPNPTNGEAADDQKVSFFAYAPYANPEAAGADNTYGITGFSTAVANDDPKDPSSPKHLHNFVNYTFSKDKPNVDLMWGYKAKVNDTTYTINNNLTRTTENVKFIFQHLLSKLGGSQELKDTTVTDPYDSAFVANGLVVKASPVSDPTKEYGNVTLGDFGGNKGTKITISKIVIASAPEIDTLTHQPVKDIDGHDISYATADQTGTLDLYTGVFKLNGAAQNIQFRQTITNKIDDPNTSEDESKADSEIADCLKEPASFASFAELPKGVVKKAINVYKDESNPIILVPGTKPVVDILVTYFVRTYDEKLPAGYSEVPQTVFGRIKFAEIKKNTKYNIVMILGLNNVKFAAEVEDWTTGVVGQVQNDLNGDGDYDDPGETTDVTDTEIGLPNNL